MERHCCICKDPTKSEKLVAVTRGLERLIKASDERGDGLADVLNKILGDGEVFVHASCRYDRTFFSLSRV